MEATPTVCLIILDGYGYREEIVGNAIAAAATPIFDRLWATCPHTLLQASGPSVGLPKGMMGNSETGHMNMGAGRIVLQKLTQISKRIEDGTFFENAAFAAAIAHVRERGSRLHLIGLIGPGGVHSYDEHLLALLQLAGSKGLEQVYVQAILDGRDTPPQSARGYVAKLNSEMYALGTGQIASLSGRYYAMDRDKRWDRTAKAYRAMVFGEGERGTDADATIVADYAASVNDEFVLPTVLVQDGQPVAQVGDGDAVIFFNFRGDRPRQLTRAFVMKDFDGFDRGAPLRDLYFVTLAEYEKDVPVVVAFPPESLDDPIETSLAQVVSELGMRQLHVAETEKYAHVTYFINGGHEEPFPGEDRVLVPSLKVATYDLAPEMSAAGVADGGGRPAAGRSAQPGDHELRQLRHGRAQRADGADDRGRGDGRPLPGPGPGGGGGGGGGGAGDGRSWQRRDDGRPGDGRAAHRAHHQPCAVRACGTGVAGAPAWCQAAGGWAARGYQPHDPGDPRRAAARRDAGQVAAAPRVARMSPSASFRRADG